MHDNPHLDELFALFLLREYGKHRFDLNSAKIGTFTVGVWPEGMSAETHSPDALFVGCGGSRFDEHGKQGYTCSARLVADFLAIGRERCFEQLLKEVEHEDRHGVEGVANHIAMVVKGMTFHDNNLVEEVYEWLKPLFASIVRFESDNWDKISKEVDALQLSDSKAAWSEKNARYKKSECPWMPFSLENGSKIIAKMIDEKFAKSWMEKGQKGLAAKQRRFEEGLVQIKESGKVVQFESYRGPVKMVVINSDNTQLGPASRKLGYDIALVQNSQGNVNITTNLKRNLWLNNVVALIRVEESKARGVDVSKLKLDREGTLKEVPNWHLHEGVPTQLYNGTLTASCVEPTAISLDRLVQLVVEGLKPRGFRQKNQNRNKSKGLVAVKEAIPAS